MCCGVAGRWNSEITKMFLICVLKKILLKNKILIIVSTYQIRCIYRVWLVDNGLFMLENHNVWVRGVY